MRLRTLALMFLLLVSFVAATLVLDRHWPMRLVYPLAYKEIIEDGAARHDLSPSLVAAVVFEESSFDRSAVSSKGAVGLMQIMPSTAEWIDSKNSEDYSDIDNPETNIALGTWYLHYLMEKYDDERLALAAYNSGQARVDGWLREHKGVSNDAVIERIPFPETRDYVKTVLETREKYQKYHGLE